MGEWVSKQRVISLLKTVSEGVATIDECSAGAYRAAAWLVRSVPSVQGTPCSFCEYNPPSEDCANKPCLTCPAKSKEDNA